MNDVVLLRNVQKLSKLSKNGSLGDPCYHDKKCRTWFWLALISDWQKKYLLACKNWSRAPIMRASETSCGRSELACVLKSVPSSAMQRRSFVWKSRWDCVCKLSTQTCLLVVAMSSRQ